MATQTKAQRSAAAKKAAATRKRNEAKGTSSSARSSARATRSQATRTARSARTTAKRSARAATRRVDAEATRLEAVGDQFRRVAYIPVGVVLTARDNLADTVRTYTDRDRAQRELRRFERRGEQAIRRTSRRTERELRSTQRDLGRRLDAATDRVQDALPVS